MVTVNPDKLTVAVPMVSAFKTYTYKTKLKFKFNG